MRPARPIGVRLQKFLADRGVGSRRRIESWIEEGRIRVDGRAAELGQRVTETSRISVDGRPIRTRAAVGKTRVILYNKPEGEICSRDDPGKRPTVFRKLPKLRGERWVIVGRLDINTRGLLLFTNNGDLANDLMHPSTGLEREYLCRVFGQVSPESLEALVSGVELDGHRAAFSSVHKQRGEGSNTWYSVVITEGKYREVRRMWEAVGCRVSRLVRVRYGGATLSRKLRQGEWEELKPAEIARLAPGTGGRERPDERGDERVTTGSKKRTGRPGPNRKKRPKTARRR